MDNWPNDSFPSLNSANLLDCLPLFGMSYKLDSADKNPKDSIMDLCKDNTEDKISVEV